jgi:taurine ABC transporter substrate-binding protein
MNLNTARRSYFLRHFYAGGTGRLLLIIGVLLVAELGACGSTPQQPTAPTKPTVVIGYENNGADPEMVAIAQGLFSKRMNANVQLKYFDSGPAALAAIASGALQIMTGIGNPPTVSAIARGVPLQVIWAQELYTRDEGLVVRSDSGIKSLKDLQGKTIALVLGSTSPFALNAALTKAGIDPSTVHELNMSPPVMRTAWSNHSIDAAYVWDPVFDTISHENGNILLTDLDVKQEAPIFNLAIANTDWARNNPNLVKGFIQAEDDAVTFYKQQPDQALQIMAQQAGITVDLAKTEMTGYQIYSAQDQLSADGLGQGASVSALSSIGFLGGKRLGSSFAPLRRLAPLFALPSFLFLSLLGRLGHFLGRGDGFRPGFRHQPPKRQGLSFEQGR